MIKLEMLNIQEYKQYIADKVFPASLLKLEQCSDSSHISTWQQEVCSLLLDKHIADQSAETSQDKTSLTMPFKFYLEAQKLMSKSATVNQLLK